MIILKNPAEIATMKQAGQAVETCIHAGFELIEEFLQKGNKIIKLDVEKIMANTLDSLGMESAFLNFDGYPFTTCISINDEIVHGLPDATKIKDGDLVTLDFGTKYRDWNADAALTKIVGKYDKSDHQETLRLMYFCNAAMDAGISQCRVGKTLGDITRAIYSTALPSGYGIVNQYTGHGIGLDMHEEPHIYNAYPVPEGYEDIKLRKGMTLCIEPMLTISPTVETITLEDKWTIATATGCLSTHSEKMIAITDGSPLTLSDPRSNR